MLRVAIIIGTTRPNRKSEQVARWVLGIASQRGEAQFELIDLREWNLPFFDEPNVPSRRQYTLAHTKARSEKSHHMTPISSSPWSITTASRHSSRMPSITCGTSGTIKSLGL